MLKEIDYLLLIQLLLLALGGIGVQVLAHVNRSHPLPLSGLWGFWVWQRARFMVRLFEGVPRGRVCLWFIRLVEWIWGVVSVEGVVVDPLPWDGRVRGLCSTERRQQQLERQANELTYKLTDYSFTKISIWHMRCVWIKTREILQWYTQSHSDSHSTLQPTTPSPDTSPNYQL